MKYSQTRYNPTKSIIAPPDFFINPVDARILFTKVSWLAATSIVNVIMRTAVETEYNAKIVAAPKIVYFIEAIRRAMNTGAVQPADAAPYPTP